MRLTSLTQDYNGNRNGLYLTHEPVISPQGCVTAGKGRRALLHKQGFSDAPVVILTQVYLAGGLSMVFSASISLFESPLTWNFGKIMKVNT